VSADPATPAPPPREWIGTGLRWPSWSRMTGDWGRARTILEARGLSFEITSASDGSGLGARPAGLQGFGRHLTTAGATFDLEKIAGLTGSRALVQYQILSGNTAAVAADVAQPFSNIDAPAFRRFAEVWIEQQIGAHARVKTGLIDANTEFAFAEHTGDFINASMGFSPTVFPLPTYPDPHLGVTVHVEPSGRIYGSVGLFNGGPAMGVRDFRAVFLVGEGGMRWTSRGGGRVSAGYWRIDGRRADADGAMDQIGTGGHYFVLDQTLWADEQHGVSRVVGASIQAGRADPRLSPFASHVGGGLTARGLIRQRPNDSVGIGLTLVDLAADTREDPAGREVVLEAFHRFVMTQWMALKPDMQIIRHSVGMPGRRTIVAGTVRIEVVF
jgi:porin